MGKDDITSCIIRQSLNHARAGNKRWIDGTHLLWVGAAIASCKSDLFSVESDIESLIYETEPSLKGADSFIAACFLSTKPGNLPAQKPRIFYLTRLYSGCP
jgi:hypothetical protein